MSSIMKILRRIGGAKVTPTAGDEGQLAVWKAGKTTTDAVSVFFHDGVQWVELIDTKGRVLSQPVVVGETAPASPVTGEFWYKASTKALSVWDGAAWANVAFTNVANVFTKNQVIDVTEAVPALRVTQKGAGAALLVEDQANPDGSPFIIDASGNVGIGMTNPTHRLEIPASGTPAASIGGFQIGANGTEILSTVGEFALKAGGPNYLAFYTNSNEHLRIDKLGNVMFEKHAVDWAATGMQYQAGAHSVIITSDDPGGCLSLRKNSSDGVMQSFFRDASTVGQIVATAGVCSYNSTSDYRLKENVSPMSDAAARVMKLKPCRFNFKSAPGRLVDGFLAHEAQEVVPEAVTGAKDAVDAKGEPIYQGVDQSKLVPLLVAALQDALKRIEALEARP